MIYPLCMPSIKEMRIDKRVRIVMIKYHVHSIGQNSVLQRLRARVCADCQFGARERQGQTKGDRQPWAEGYARSDLADAEPVFDRG